jgi:Collagen triple helix repeat (20 copies)
VINRTIASLISRARKSRFLSLAMIGVVLLLVAGTVGAADVAPTSFFGCLTSGGIINKITTDANNPPNCQGNSTAVSWNQVGPPGAQGPQGPPGPQGPQGQTGATGATGATGPQGQTGGTGPQGPAGADGAAGPAGPAGADGAAGPAGPAGADGAAGPAGPPGPGGPAGPAGAGLNSPGFVVSDLPRLTNSVEAVGADGFPVIAGSTPIGGLRVVHCLDTTCSRTEENEVASTSQIKPSIAIESDGYPLIAFNDGNLSVVACFNTSCSQHLMRTLDPAGRLSDQGVRPSSIAIGTDGFPLISYVVIDGGSAKVAHCPTVDCVGGTPVITDLNAASLGSAPKVDTSVAIGVDGLGLIALGGNELTAVHCSNVDCTTSTVSIPCAVNSCVTADAMPLDSVAMALGADGLALIGGRSAGLTSGTRHPFLHHCADTLCNAGVTSDTEVGAGIDRGEYSWITLGVNGHPLMTYRDTTNTNLRAAYCLDFACTTFNVTTIDTTDSEFSSVVTGVDGLPLVVAGDSTTRQLKAFHCSNIFCVPYPRNR